MDIQPPAELILAVAADDIARGRYRPQCIQLPVELILEISGHIADPRDINAFMQTCRLTHYTMFTELYRVAMIPTFVTKPADGQPPSQPARQDYLAAAARKGCAAALARMLDLCPDIAGYCAFSSRLLICALHSNHPPAVALLLDRGWDLARHIEWLLSPSRTIQVHPDLPPLHIAAAGRPAAAMLRLLVARGAALEQRARPDADGSTALIHAAGEAAREAVETLLALGADVEARTSRGLTALRVAVDMMGEAGDDVAILDVLIAAGADMVACGALHSAAVSGNLAVVSRMVKAGADVSAVFRGPGNLIGKRVKRRHWEDKPLPLKKTALEYYDQFYEPARIPNRRTEPALRKEFDDKKNLVRKMLSPRSV